MPADGDSTPTPSSGDPFGAPITVFDAEIDPDQVADTRRRRLAEDQRVAIADIDQGLAGLVEHPATVPVDQRRRAGTPPIALPRGADHGIARGHQQLAAAQRALAARADRADRAAARRRIRRRTQLPSRRGTRRRAAVSSGTMPTDASRYDPNCFARRKDKCAPLATSPDLNR